MLVETGGLLLKESLPEIDRTTAKSVAVALPGGAVITDKLVIEVHSNAELSFSDEIVVTLRAKYVEVLSKVIQV